MENLQHAESTMRYLLDKLKKREQKDLYNKYIIAIQDINELDNLEEKIPIVKSLRIRGFLQPPHYLDHDDSSNMIDVKRSILSTKIENIPNDIKIMFDSKYPNLLNDITKHITPITIQSKQMEEYVNEWWE